MRKGSCGWIFGLLFGTLLGVLFAPKKGEQLRDNIRKERAKGGSGISAIKNAYLNMGDDIADTAKDVYTSDDVQEVVGKAKNKAKEAKEKAKELADYIAEESDGAVKEIKKHAKKVQKKAEKAAKKVHKTVKKISKKKK